jgi:exopolysaccharide biosynthesis WecB/TagA/CpsF family protein
MTIALWRTVDGGERAGWAGNRLASNTPAVPERETVAILGVPYEPFTTDQAIARVVELHDRPAPATVFHANVHTVNLASDDPSYKQVLQSADLVLNDGKGVMLGAKLLGKSLPQDLNGNFFSPFVLREAAARSWPVFFYGAKPGVAERAAHRLAARFSGLNIVGTSDGYVQPDDMPTLIDKIKASGATLVMVALGNPGQERWLAEHLTATGANLGIGVGAFFDFQAGEIDRAPSWMSTIGLEWVYRLVKEPKRMWKRYLVGNPRFVINVLRQRFSRRI